MPRDDSGANMSAVITQINVLNSKISLIIQRLKELEDKFSIISRTVISHNTSIKELQSKSDTTGGVSGSPFSKSGSVGSEEFTSLKQEIENIKEEIKEMKYVLDTVNPVAYVTVDEVSDIVDQKLLRKKEKSK